MVVLNGVTRFWRGMMLIAMIAAMLELIVPPSKVAHLLVAWRSWMPVAVAAC